MKFWQSLAFVEFDQMVELAVFCEELGFHGVSYGDHLVTTAEQIDEYEYGDQGNILWDPETHWPDPWVMTAALSQATRTLNFLSTVYILPLRDPLSAAKAVSTAAYMSGDRVTLGVGVGWQKAEFDMVGQDFHTRGKRTNEMLTLLRGLMSGEMTDFEGEFYKLPAVKMSPGTRKPVPILVGGYAPAAMRRAASQDGWMATSHEEAEIYPLLDALNSVRREQQDADKPFEVWSGVKNPGDGTHERLAEAGVTMVNGCNFLSEDGRTALSSIEDKKRRLETFAEQFLVSYPSQ
jgi:probable F420-dependent oxidoreductase